MGLELRAPCEHGRYERHGFDPDEEGYGSICFGGYQPAADELITYLFEIGALSIEKVIEWPDMYFRYVTPRPGEPSIPQSPLPYPLPEIEEWVNRNGNW